MADIYFEGIKFFYFLWPTFTRVTLQTLHVTLRDLGCRAPLDAIIIPPLGDVINVKGHVKVMW